MTAATCLPASAAAVAPAARRGALPAWLLACLLAAALLAGSPCWAGAVSAPNDLPAEAPAGGAKLLDKALNGDVSTGSRNLDMLLEMHRSDAAEAGRPMPAPRPAAATPGQAQPLPALPPQLPPPPLPSVQRPQALSHSALLGAEANLGAAKPDPPESRREWRGDAALSVGQPVQAGGPSSEPQVLRDDPLMRLLYVELSRFLQENLAWLLSAMILALVVLGIVKVYARRA